MGTEERMALLAEYARRVPGIDADDLTTMLQVDHYAERVYATIDKYLEGLCGLSVSRFKVLRTLFHDPDHCLTPAELAGRVYLTRASMTSALDGLERMGYVRRTPHPVDRRMISVHLTPEGIALMEEILPAHYREVLAAFGVLTKADRTVLLKLYEKLLAGLGDLPGSRT